MFGCYCCCSISSLPLAVDHSDSLGEESLSRREQLMVHPGPEPGPLQVLGGPDDPLCWSDSVLLGGPPAEQAGQQLRHRKHSLCCVSLQTASMWTEVQFGS